MIPKGFELWSEGLILDKKLLLIESKSCFEASAKAFFEDASGSKIARALLEYSTVMDAYSILQEGRLLKELLNYDEALASFAKASEILRATVHFGFLSPYISGCASLETASEIQDNDEKFQAYKNSIALFEQSKFALSFRDDHHPLLRSIDAMVKLGISRALLLESEMLHQKGLLADSRRKREQFKSVEEDFQTLSGTAGSSLGSRIKIDYFLKGYECDRAVKGTLITSFPEKTLLWIGNVGKNPALVEKLGKSVVDKTLPAFESISWPMSPEFHGKLRIVYLDAEDKQRYDEGCLTVI